MNAEIVLQFVRQKRVLFYSVSNNWRVKNCLCSCLSSNGTDRKRGKEDFRTMSRGILVWAFTDKDRKKGQYIWRERFR